MLPQDAGRSGAQLATLNGSEYPILWDDHPVAAVIPSSKEKRSGQLSQPGLHEAIIATLARIAHHWDMLRIT
jgi:hypothetical protein